MFNTGRAYMRSYTTKRDQLCTGSPHRPDTRTHTPSSLALAPALPVASPCSSTHLWGLMSCALKIPRTRFSMRFAGTFRHYPMFARSRELSSLAIELCPLPRRRAPSSLHVIAGDAFVLWAGHSPVATNLIASPLTGKCALTRDDSRSLY